VAVFLRTPSLILTYVAFAGNTFLSTAYLTWLPSYFNRFQHLTMEQSSLKTASVMLFAIVGAPLGGFLADAWMKRRITARPLFAGFSSLAAAAIWLVSFGLLQGTAQWVVMMVGAIATVCYLSAASAVTQDVVHPGLWAVSYSVCVIVQNALGSSMGPLVLGAISDAYGLNVAMLLAPLTSVFAGLLFLAAAAYYRRDLAKVDKVKVEMES